MTREPRRAAPPDLRWATGGGSAIGDCNGYHLATTKQRGTLCGRYGPVTPPNPPSDFAICGTCARIAKVAKVEG